LSADARVKSALQYLRDDDARSLREQIELTQIPAPPFKESVRAADFAGRLRAAGLADVSIDATGNVIGKRPGRGRGPLLVLSAHLDTVFPEGTDLTVKQDGARWSAPGIIDDSRGLAAVLSVLRAMETQRIVTVGDVWFVGTVGEEALGNLRGVKALFGEQPRIDGFISVDGPEAPEHVRSGHSEIVAHATGSRRWEIRFTGPGGHSFENFGNPSAVHAMGRAIATISELRTPSDPRTTFNVGIVSGGTGVTAIASEAVMGVDMRSNDAQQLADLERTILAAVDDAVSAENARWKSGEIRAERKLVGDRPASTRATNPALVEAAVGAYGALGLATPVLRFASTDSNVPLGLGIPAATLHGGGIGDKAHSSDEWYEHVNAWRGPQLILLTTLRLVGVKGVSKPALAVRLSGKSR
jgi:acetylornithine deacetylase/succinyl-diaminopimelate desuccinylase-like protein